MASPARLSMARRKGYRDAKNMTQQTQTTKGQGKPELPEGTPVMCNGHSGDSNDEEHDALVALIKAHETQTNNAEKLAEALREAVAILTTYDHLSGVDKMKSALAQWEEKQ